MAAQQSPQAKLAPVFSAVEKLDSLLSEIPQEFLAEFENAAKELFASRRATTQDDTDRNGSESVEPRLKRQKVQETAMEKIKAVQCWLRDQVPPEAVLPSEALRFEHKGTDFAGYTAGNTLSVDGFLYDEGDVDELCDAGKLARNYCTECGSRKTAPLNFISHSLSIPELRFLMATALPAVCTPSSSSLCDVGSRLGAVLFGASILGGFRRAVGVEINPDLCKVQEAALGAFGLEESVRVVCGDVLDNTQLIADAQVVVLHNAFQFFLAPENSLRCWRAIAAATKPGTWVVACPSLEEQLACCTGGEGGEGAKKKGKQKKGKGAARSTAFALDAWVEEQAMDYPMAETEDDEYADEEGRLFTNIRLYKVKAALA